MLFATRTEIVSTKKSQEGLLYLDDTTHDTDSNCCHARNGCCGSVFHMGNNFLNIRYLWIMKDLHQNKPHVSIIRPCADSGAHQHTAIEVS